MKFALTIACFLLLANVQAIFGLTCDANEEEARCTTTCIARCPPPAGAGGVRPTRPSLLGNLNCPTVCLRTPVCVCKGGFVKARTGKCVLLADCAKEDGLLGLGVVG